ncbi:MAG: DUF4129 domain-containing protein [Terriglobales bacterium]
MPVTATAQPETVPAPLTLKQYIQTLDDSIAALQEIRENPQRAEDFLHRLPSAWHVDADGRSFEVSTESIRRDLGAWQTTPHPAALDPVLQHLETLRFEAAAYEAPAPDFASRHSLLNGILSRREFRNVHGQTWMDRLKQRLTELLIKLLGRMFRSSMIPVVGDILVYGLIALAVLALAYWMYRSLRESARLETIMPVAVSVSAKEWPIWMSEAQAAAARGEWRDAIHLAYWAGISFLEAQGAWRPDSARTPREYLRLLPAASAHRPALRALTLRLEGVWYGMQAAGAEGFQQTVAELERLGCPCN